LVLPIGGLKEKLLAAHRAGIKRVLIPIENKKDLIEVPKTVLESVDIIPVKNVDEVLKVALTKPLKSVEWVEVDQISSKEKLKKEELSTH
jgi:ATP-dependent Lon protease